MNQVFVHDQLIRFSHCDPAAIVYFPRFFDLAHATMEDWLADGLGFPLPGLITERRIGTPTVRVTKIGNASVNLQYLGVKDSVEHLRITQTIVFMDLDAARATPIPEDIRPAIEAFLAVTDETGEARTSGQ